MIWGQYGGLDALREAVPYSLRRGLAGEALADIARLARALARGGFPANSPLWAGTWALQLESLLNLGRFQEGEVIRTRIVEHPCESPAGKHALAMAAYAGAFHLLTTSPADAVEPFARALVHAETLGEERLEGLVRAGLSVALQFAGDLVRAEESSAAAVAKARATGAAVVLGNALRVRAELRLNQGNLEGAASDQQGALSAFLDAGREDGLALSQAGLGDIARARGDLATAEVHYVEAVRLIERSGRSVPQLHLSLASVAVLRGDFDGAEQVFSRTQAFAERHGHGVVLVMVALGRLPGHAAQGRWSAWDATMRDLDPPVDQDHAAVFALAGDLAAQAGEATRAQDAWSRAAGMWERLGQPDRARALRERHTH
jgi:tetratricopeptide (TPR) repeat protein